MPTNLLFCFFLPHVQELVIFIWFLHNLLRYYIYTYIKKVLYLLNSLLIPAMSRLTASICWNILAHKTEEVSEVGVKIYQKPESNGIYELRRKKNPPLCKENENPDAAWYAKMSLLY